MSTILKKGQKVIYVDRRDNRHEGVVKVPNTKAQPDYCTVEIDDGVFDEPRNVHVAVLSLENPVGSEDEDTDE